MNRNEAKKYIGKQIRVVDPQIIYIGELLDIITEPKKPWRAIVKIKAIDKNACNSEEIQPTFIIGDIYEIIGTKIEPIEAFPLTNDDLFDFEYVTVEKEGDIVYLRDENNNHIQLEDCPFDFQIKVKGKWISAHYSEGLLFIDEYEKSHQVKEGAQIRINKAQFDPYQLLLNELDQPALDSLNSGLKKYQVSHEDCVNCHNSLINQYLTSENQHQFKGVNFISYQNDETTLIVQHHYEREVSDEHREDSAYDRFEMTNDKGKRLVMTYTTEISK